MLQCSRFDAEVSLTRLVVGAGLSGRSVVNLSGDTHSYMPYYAHTRTHTHTDIHFHTHRRYKHTAHKAYMFSLGV